MRYLILSDLHANLEATDAVLADASHASVDRTVVLGDIVGYGADPNAVVERVQRLAPDVIIRGNHDKVAAGIEEPEGFNAAARQAAVWTSSVLTPDARAYLARLPAGPIDVDRTLLVCHGSPSDEDHYIFEDLDAIRALSDIAQRVCFFGHTHVQMGYSLQANLLDVLLPGAGTESRIELAREARYLVNPGSVGQPRDGDPRAAYAVFDSTAHVVWFRRVAYDVASAQAKIAAAGLPEALARRLGLGR